jgi:hypothetical protein
MPTIEQQETWGLGREQDGCDFEGSSGDGKTAPFRARYMALIFSIMPGGQLLARSDDRYFFCANSRNAFTSGV